MRPITMRSMFLTSTAVGSSNQKQNGSSRARFRTRIGFDRLPLVAARTCFSTMPKIRTRSMSVTGFDLLLHVVHHCPQLAERRGQDRLYGIQHELRSTAVFLNAAVRADHNKGRVKTVKASK